jgi:hypothetical protein
MLYHEINPRRKLEMFYKDKQGKLEVTVGSFDGRLTITFQTRISCIGKPNLRRKGRVILWE